MISEPMNPTVKQSVLTYVYLLLEDAYRAKYDVTHNNLDDVANDDVVVRLESDIDTLLNILSGLNSIDDISTRIKTLINKKETTL